MDAHITAKIPVIAKTVSATFSLDGRCKTLQLIKRQVFFIVMSIKKGGYPTTAVRLHHAEIRAIESQNRRPVLEFLNFELTLVRRDAVH